ncbi:MAG: YHYH protein [Chitinophagaceae bacterium]
MKKLFVSAAFLTALFMGMGCKKTSSVITTTGTVPDVFKKFNSSVTISSDGTYITLKSNGLPDHKSPYYGVGNAKYEAYNGTNPAFAINPNLIISQNLTFKIPANPTVATAHDATPLGPMGISVNGVPIFNQYAAGGVPLTGEINSFDQYNGHPQMSGQYHYHVEPLYITATKGKDALIGFLLDGFPIYGPMENGATVTAAMLDVYHGHTSITADYPAGIYHYHITADAPYINGNGFYGTKGTVTQ